MKFDISHIITVISQQCDIKKVSVTEMLRRCGLSKDLVTNMKKGSTPSVDKLLPIADYFGISLDDLVRGDIDKITKTEETTMTRNTNPLAEDEMEMLRLYRSLSLLDKHKLLSFAEDKAKATEETAENVG